MTYEQYFKRFLGMIEGKLQGILRSQETRPVSIHKAMQYATFTGGKRFRPVLALSACEACGGKPQ
ncbi:MAG: polyprenyl synthetase family protein, partial [Candidatus Omnitrophota bacterium]